MCIVCMCMCVYVHTRQYIDKHVYAHTHLSIYTDIHLRMCTYSYLHMRAFVYHIKTLRRQLGARPTQPASSKPMMPNNILMRPCCTLPATILCTHIRCPRRRITHQTLEKPMAHMMNPFCPTAFHHQVLYKASGCQSTKKREQAPESTWHLSSCVISQHGWDLSKWALMF